MEILEGQLIQAEAENNTIDSEGFHEAYELMVEMGAKWAAIEMNKMFRWRDNSPWREWNSTEGGKWTKRFATYLYKEKGEKIGTEILEKVGEILKRHVPPSEKIFFEVAKYCDWQHGAFEPTKYSPDGKPPGACWWGQYSNVRKGLIQDEGGYSVLFYESEKQFNTYQRKKGIGRCWMYRRSDNEAVIFNAYGPYRLNQIASVLASEWKLPYKKIKLFGNGYINAGEYNNDGRGGGDVGLGYYIGDKNIDYLEMPAFEFKDKNCHVCGLLMSSKNSMKMVEHGEVIHLCYNCYETHIMCGKCGDLTSKHDVNRTADGYNICDRCAKSAHSCEHGLVLNAVRIWHTSRYACPRCFDRGIVQTCDGCNRVQDRDKVTILRLRNMRVVLCRGCMSKIRRQQYV